MKHARELTTENLESDEGITTVSLHHQLLFCFQETESYSENFQNEVVLESFVLIGGRK